jgi:beta-lactamase superfamily II metal-dependent hydrolase
MKTTVNILPASDGDCILIHTFDNAKQPFIILIDGGRGKTFKNTLKKAIQEYEKIDLVILTHIHNDHIGGLLKLFKSSLGKKIIFDKIIVNAPNLIAFSKEEEIGYNEAYDFEKEIIANYKDIKIINDITNLNDKNLGLPEGIEITFLSPDLEALNRLKKDWKPLGKDSEDTFISSVVKPCEDHDKTLELLAETDDITQPPSDIENASSLAFILKTNDFNGLFLGDAHHKIVSESIKKCAEKHKLSLPLQFNLIKVSHHGSIENSSIKLLNLIQSENFIFSTNGGKTGKHPSRTTIAKIVCNPNRTTKTINLCTNYPLEEVEKRTGALLNPNEETKHNFNLLNKTIFQ